MLLEKRYSSPEVSPQPLGDDDSRRECINDCYHFSSIKLSLSLSLSLSGKIEKLEFDACIAYQVQQKTTCLVKVVPVQKTLALDATDLQGIFHILFFNSESIQLI
jgi:hypothetical protein